MSSTTVEVNGTESDALPLTLHALRSEFPYNDDDSPGPVPVLNSDMVNGESVQTPASFTVNESIATTKCASPKRNLPNEETEQSSYPKSPRLSSSTALIVATSDYQQSPENKSPPSRCVESSQISSPVTSKRGNAGRSKLEMLTQNGLRRSSRLSRIQGETTTDGTKLKRIMSCVEEENVEQGYGTCKKIKLTASSNKKQSKLKSVSVFVGEPVPEHEAQERWGWRYELKGQRRKGQSGILNAGEEDEVHVNVVCHYVQANVNGYIFSLGDCAHIKGEGKQQHVGRIVEFFKTSDDENYFRVQWFFRAEDTVMQKAAAFHDKKRLFSSNLMNDNLLECILSKVKVIEKAPMVGFKSTSIQPSEYYCDMEYSVKYSTFRSLVIGKRNVLVIIMPSQLVCLIKSS
ncbi:hypothetical protein R6Q57_006692 [Mikania cordata]